MAKFIGPNSFVHSNLLRNLLEPNPLKRWDSKQLFVGMTTRRDVITVAKAAGKQKKNEKSRVEQCQGQSMVFPKVSFQAKR